MVTCATPGCSSEAASSRAKFCRQCFAERARTNNSKRKRRGGNNSAQGVAGNKGNTSSGHPKKNAGKRSGVKRSAKHALVVKKPWLDKILTGEKDWEIRSSRTSQRGWVFFAQSKATGQLLGRARLVGCLELSAEEFKRNVHRHRVAKWSDVPYKRVFAWVLERAERFEKPFAFAHRPGAVVWVKVR
jgi:hypothetical protein